MVQRLVPKAMLVSVGTNTHVRPYQVSALQPLWRGGMSDCPARLICDIFCLRARPSQASLPPAGMSKLLAGEVAGNVDTGWAVVRTRA